MTPPRSTLLVGATGLLGGHVAGLLRKAGRPVRALIRATAASEKRAILEAAGVELVEGDLKAPDSLRLACRDVATVVSTASSTVSRQPGDSIASVDERGQLALIEAAESEGVEHFVFVSFPPRPVDYSLQRAKRSVERRLHEGRMSFTVLQPVNFMEVWLSPRVGFDLRGGAVKVFGSGEHPVRWISVVDVARSTVIVADDRRFVHQVIPLFGPDPLSPLDVVRMYEEMTGQNVQVSHVDAQEIADRLRAPLDERDETYAAITLAMAQGLLAQQAGAAIVPERLTSVREYLTRSQQTTGAEGGM